jgi:predicted nucleotidyltransferase
MQELATLFSVNPREIEAVLGRELPRLVPGLCAAYLFGSFGRGEAQADSDLDIGLLYASPPASTLRAQPFTVAAELESLLGRPVDIVVLNTAPVDLVHRVLRDGRLLLQSNPSARIAFEIRARNEYFDILPFLRRYRRTEGAA